MRVAVEKRLLGMKANTKTLLAMVFSICSISNSIAQDDILIFGGDGHDQFLGCLVCNEFGSDSICNGYGKYGNEYSSEGMFNEYSGFGNEYKSSSPWNEYSSSKSVPVLVDRKGKFYGYFTINDGRHDAVDFASDLNKIYKAVDGDLEKVRKLLCKSFGYSG
jgi:hypothetical protein